MNKRIITLLLIIGLLTLSACNNDSKTSGIQGKLISSLKSIDKISDIKLNENIGKTFTVKGKVVNVMKTQISGYAVSGYKLDDSTGTIAVSSKTLPKMNDTITVTGTLQQSRNFGLILTTAD